MSEQSQFGGNEAPISVVIAARNAANVIGECLDSLRSQTVPDLLREIIVVDNNSTDDTARVAAEAGATVVHQPRVGAAAARNAGIAAASGDVICITDADCRPVADWLESISAPLRLDPSISASKGSYRTEQKELFARFVQLEYEDKYDLLRKHETIDFVDTYSASYRRDSLVASGGFDERIFYVEDQELSFRLAAAGCKMVFQEEAVVYHLHADSLYSYLRKKFFIGYWKAQVVRRFPNVVVRDSHTPQVIKVQMALALAMVVALASAVLAPTSALIVAGAFLAGFVMTTIPFARKAWRSDKTVALLSSAMLFVRASGLTAGFIAGTVRAMTGRRPEPVVTPA